MESCKFSKDATAARKLRLSTKLKAHTAVSYVEATAFRKSQAYAKHVPVGIRKFRLDISRMNDGETFQSLRDGRARVNGRGRLVGNEPASVPSCQTWLIRVPFD